METPKVTDREKEMYGEDAARYTSGYNSYMKEKENAETPQQLETIEKRFKQFEDTFDSKTIGVALRLMDEEREKNFLFSNILKLETYSFKSSGSLNNSICLATSSGDISLIILKVFS